MHFKVLAISAIGVLAAACGTTPGERALSGGAIGAATGAVIGNNVGEGDATTGAIIGGAVGAVGGAVTAPRDVENRRQYFDNRSGRYYFYDSRSGRYFYENGEPYP